MYWNMSNVGFTEITTTTTINNLNFCLLVFSQGHFQFFLLNTCCIFLLLPLFLNTQRFSINVCRGRPVFKPTGSAAVAFWSAGRGLQRGAEWTWGSTSASVSPAEAETAAMCKEVRSVLWQGRRPRPDSGGTEAVFGPLRWVSHDITLGQELSFFTDL